MNKPLVERIERLIGLCADPGTEQELPLMLADVRELVEAAKEFAECDGYPAHDRLSAILRKVGGDIGTAPSPAAVEAQNSAVKVPDDVMDAARFLVDSANNRASATVYEFLQSLTHPTETPR